MPEERGEQGGSGVDQERDRGVQGEPREVRRHRVPDEHDGWPEDQQKYTLYTRKGWQGLKPEKADDGWQTWVLSSYVCLPKCDLGGAADAHTDGMNYEGHKLHHPVNNPPIQPGRGMGCADIPGLKIIGDLSLIHI